MKITLDYEFPKGLIDLSNLEKKHKDWNKTPNDDKEKMTALALENGGVDALIDRPNYLQYLNNLSTQLKDSILAGDQKEMDRMYAKLSWLTGLLHNFYSSNMKRKRETRRKEAKIYVKVELYRRNHLETTKMDAARHIAKELGEEVNWDAKYVQTRYYKFIQENGNMSLEDVVILFQLPITV